MEKLNEIERLINPKAAKLAHKRSSKVPVNKAAGIHSPYSTRHVLWPVGWRSQRRKPD
jgi:hypothetical protein